MSSGQHTFDRSELSVKAIVFSVLFTGVFLILTVWIGGLFYEGSRSSEMDKKEATTSDFQQKEDLHRYEDERLNTSKEPIENAMKAVVQNYAK